MMLRWEQGKIMAERRRSQKAIANDKAILNAAVEEIVRVGIDRVSLRDVGHVAGLTHGATYARYEDVSELLIEVWNATLNDRLVTMFDLSRNAAERPGSRTVGELSDFIREADSRDRAAIEMLLVSRRVPTLLEETERFVQSYLEPVAKPTEAHTRTIILFGVVMVQIFTNAQYGLDVEFHSALEKLLIETLSSSTSSPQMGEELASGARQSYVPEIASLVAPEQGYKSMLTHATYDVIGRSGYVGATISRIARRSRCSPALVYKLHRSKEDLVLGAFADLVTGFRLNPSMMAKVLDEGFLASVLHSETTGESERHRDFCLETLIAASHSDTMRPIVLGELVQGASARTVLGERDDEETIRFDYAVRTVIAVVMSVSWLATITSSINSLDMSAFAEPLRCGVQNQWFPGTG
jgi:AcrR family transcriptional regulator